MPDKHADVNTEYAKSQGPKERAAAFRHNLPAELTSFVGRQRELQAIDTLLRNRRLLTLTGSGGSGKTRLALEAARQQLPRYPDGVFYVSLAPLNDPELVIDTIASVLGVQERADETIFTALRRYLSGRKTLLLLDNFEHLLGEAPPLGDLLAAAPDLTLLVTSREPLRLYGERQYPVEPLVLSRPEDATPETILQASAVQLFVQRAQAVRPDLSLDLPSVSAIARICTLLDGLPLAIELAAARTHLFSPPALLERLEGETLSTLELLALGPRDQPKRLQTLYAAIEWSYHLLLPEEQALFRRLSVFAGGSTLKAIAAVCHDNAENEQTSIVLASSLVDKNLLTIADGPDGEPRFSMLHVIHEYARARLERHGEATEVAERHARYYLALAEHEDAAHGGPESAHRIDLLEREHDNLRVAMGWTIAHHRVELVLRAAHGLLNLWVFRGHMVEGRRWLERVLAASDDVPAGLRAAGLHVLSVIYSHQDDDHTALELNRRALALYRQAGNRQGIAHTLAQDGNNLGFLNRLDEAWVSLEESLRTAREIGNNHIIIEALSKMASIAHFRQEYTRSNALFQQVKEIASETGNRMSVAAAIYHQGMALSQQGAHEAGLAKVEQALELVRSLRYPTHEATMEITLGFINWRLGNLDRARSLLLKALQTLVELDIWGLKLAGCCNGLAAVAAAQRQDERAVRLLAAADFYYGAYPLGLYRRKEREQLLATIRDRLPPTTFEQAWTAGRRLAEDGGDQFIAFVRGPDLASTRRPPRIFDLTPRQLDVLRLVAQGLSDAEVAERLVISPRTVNNHLTAIYSKLDVHSRTAAARVAQENDLL